MKDILKCHHPITILKSSGIKRAVSKYLQQRFSQELEPVKIEINEAEKSNEVLEQRFRGNF